MKKVFLLIAMALFAVVNPAMAQTEKQIAKAVKKTVRQYEAEGWKPVETGTLELIITRHFTKLYASKNLQELTGNANAKRSLNIAQTVARNNAIDAYAEKSRSLVRARMNTHISDMPKQQAEAFVAGYERLVSSIIDGQLQASYHLYKRNQDGTYDVRAIYIVNEEEAAKMRKKAAMQAIEDAKVDHKFANQISQFVQEGFDNINQ